MGFRFRKSTKIGPFRITASKSGISTSVGGKGFRVTKQANGKIRKTYSIPGTGISYSETTSTKKKKVKKESPAFGEAQRHLTIAHESAEIVNTTVKPDVFFERYDLMISELEWLSSKMPRSVFSGEKPWMALVRIRAQREQETNRFIKRSYDAAVKGANQLKTERGRQNRISRYFDDMHQYNEYLYPSSQDLLSTLRSQHAINNDNTNPSESTDDLIDSAQEYTELVVHSESPSEYDTSQHRMNSSEPPPPQNRHIISWIFSILLLIVGLSAFLVSIYSGFLILLSGLVVNPIVRSKIHLSRAISIVLAIILFVIGFMMIPTDEQDSTLTVGSAETKQVVEKTETKSKESKKESKPKTVEEEIQLQLDELFPNAYVLDSNYPNSYYSDYTNDSNIVFISLFPENIDEIATGVQNGDSKAEKDWSKFLDTISELTVTTAEKAGQSCCIDVCSDSNHHIKYISIIDGNLIYNTVSDS